MDKFLKDLPLGSLISHKNWKMHEEVIKWRKIADNHYSNGDVVLISDKIITYKAFDAREPNNNSDDIKSKGNNRYIQSNIRQWLNSDKTNWYEPQHDTDQKPNKENLSEGYNPYDKVPGFLYDCPNDFKESLLNTNLEVAKAKKLGGGKENSLDKVFLLSLTEAGFKKDNEIDQGKHIQYFDSDEKRITIITDAINNKNGFIANNINWFLRSPFSISESRVYCIDNEGYLFHTSSDNSNIGIRPVIRLNGSTLTKTSGNEYLFNFSGLKENEKMIQLQDNKGNKLYPVTKDSNTHINYKLGNLSELKTENKSNLVEAINEANSGGVSSSTIVIANYDSHENSKESADIVINKGENAAEKINEAIQSLKGTGGEVKLMEGNYNLEYGIAVNVDGVHLTGIPKATILVQNKAWKGNPSNNDRRNVIDTWREDNRENVNVEISNIYVKGANISGSNGFYCAGSSQITNCTSKNSGSDGFWCLGSSTVINCISENSGNDGFACYGSSKVTNCISENSGRCGFRCADSSKVTNCVSENSGDDGFWCSGSSKVINCISENSGGSGFYCSFTFKGICGHNTLVGDKLDDNSSSTAIVQYNIIQEEV